MASQAVPPAAVSASPNEGAGLAWFFKLVPLGWSKGLPDSPRVGGNGGVSFKGSGFAEAARRRMGGSDVRGDAVLRDGEIPVDSGSDARFEACTETGRPGVLARAAP